MSLYNMMNGFNPSVFLVLPMLDLNPDQYPRFRDCFIDGDNILIYTRTGGENREHYSDGNEKMRKIDGFIKDYDDDFDYTYAHWVFKCPDKWKKDFDFIKSNDLGLVSDEYKEQIKKIYPILFDKLVSIFEKKQ